MIQMLTWFFNTPTPIITILSLTIAFYTYKYQRKWNKRKHTQELTEWYAKYAIPKFRYLNCILNEIGYMEVVQKFSKYEDFDSKELLENLNKASSSIEEIQNLFSKITADVLDKAYSQSGASDYIAKCNANLKNICVIGSGIDYKMFKKFVIDLLNEIEL